VIKIRIQKCPKLKIHSAAKYKIIYAQPTGYFQIRMLKLHYLLYILAAKNIFPKLFLSLYGHFNICF